MDECTYCGVAVDDFKILGILWQGYEMILNVECECGMQYAITVEITWVEATGDASSL